LLFDLEGWSHAEIAASLGTSEAMSRQHVMLGRRKLRQLLTSKGLHD
jgi:DNA-directed RNA polymerase specialized sigma24 family protein